MYILMCGMGTTAWIVFRNLVSTYNTKSNSGHRLFHFCHLFAITTWLLLRPLAAKRQVYQIAFHLLYVCTYILVVSKCDNRKLFNKNIWNNTKKKKMTGTMYLTHIVLKLITKYLLFLKVNSTIYFLIELIYLKTWISDGTNMTIISRNWNVAFWP